MLKSFVIDSFQGLHNKQPPRSIPKNALADAIDVDLSDTGVLTQRPGYQLAKNIPVSNAYSTLDRRAYIISGGILCQVLDNLSLLSLTPCSGTSFDDFKQFLFVNDGTQVNHDTVVNLKLPIPAFAPQLTASTGTLPPGTYRAVSTFKAASGLESGPSPMAVIELTSPGNISIQGDIAPAGHTITNWITEANGTVFYRPDGVPISPLQLNSQSMPDGELISFHKSRLWLSKSLPKGHSVIWFSKEFTLHWWDMEEDYIIIPGQALMIASSSQGLVIGTHEAIYAYNDGLEVLADYGCVRGRPMVRTAEEKLLIWSTRGFCSYPPFTNHTISKATVAPGSICSVATMDSDGISRVVCLNDGLGEAYNARS